MKRIFLLIAGAATVASLASSCNKDLTAGGVALPDGGHHGGEIAVMSGVVTRGYVDGAVFYEKATADMHNEGVVTTPRQMHVSAYYTPISGQTGEAANYFVDQIFALKEGETVWRHTPAIYWPLASNLDFLAYSSTEPFSAKDATWNAKNASSSLVLSFDESRTQDDVLFAATQMTSADAYAVPEGAEAGSPKVAQSVNMTFEHAQAWLEFQLSVADSSMMDKIAIKDITIENAARTGVLTLTRNDADVTAKWEDFSNKEDIIFDDIYGVYGRLKTAADFVTESEAVASAKDALKSAKDGGDAAAIKTAEDNLAAAQEALDEAVGGCALSNALNAVGARNERPAPSAAAETAQDCSYLDMLLPAQGKTAFVIHYILAGQNKVLEYRYALGSGSSKWERGTKYIYDIDFQISELTIAPTVKEFVATFDADATPVEIQ